MKDIHGNQVNSIDTYLMERHNNFKYEFIELAKLTKKEQIIFSKTNEIINLIGSKPRQIKDIKISEVMQKDIISYLPAGGLWDPNNGWIIIKRSELNSLKSYAAVLLHEVSHARSGAADVTRKFEDELTSNIGILVEQIL